MTLWNGSYPFYPGVNARFPFDTIRAVIVTVFLSILVTSIIILPGIPGRGVSGGAGAVQTSGPCLCIPHSSSFPDSITDLASKPARRLMARALVSLESHGAELQPILL